jgi:ribosomal protein S18 acetylase RimI-like enzyme
VQPTATQVQALGERQMTGGGKAMPAPAAGRIVALSAADPTAVRAVARLHRLLIPDSPVAMLGPTFMERFYYGPLIRQGLVHCDVYEHGGGAVGFISYTCDPDHFMRAGIRGNLARAITVGMRVMLEDPRRVVKLIKGFQLEHAHKGCQAREAAVLSFGVLPDYRDPRFCRRSGLRISTDLFGHALDALRLKGFDTVRMIVGPENREALLFYRQFDCSYQTVVAAGRRWVKVTCRCDAADEP